MNSKQWAERGIRTRWCAALLALVAVATAGLAQLGASEEQSAPRAVFLAPADGATVTSPVSFEFGVENFEISPVPEVVEQVRAGIGHYHIGFDTVCLAVGEEIPKADPWVHFGDGSATFETLLEPGEHTFALQIGDDEHRTLEGLCETITVTVE